MVAAVRTKEGQSTLPSVRSPSRLSSNEFEKRTSQPLLDRAISGTYPPGSTFKLVVAAAGLQDNIINKDFHIQDTGVLKLGDFSFSNWYFSQYGGTEDRKSVV